VDDDRLPAETEPLVSEDLRERGIKVLQALLAGGKVDLDRFQTALDGLLKARTHAGFAAVLRSLPPPVQFTPPALRREEALEISTSMGEVRLEGRWQVGSLTKIDTGMGDVTIDLTEAEFDDWDVKIVVNVGMGSVTVIAPEGLDVRQVGRNTAFNSTLHEPIPGFPVVRLSASCTMGTIRLMHPKEKRQRRWGRRRR
jgi:cell wall-active antibiotic response 4TMS protein YvqF